MSKPTGGPAFPVVEHNHDGSVYRQEFGMTLRDYFAAKALQAILEVPDYDGYKHEYAKWAYEYADAMLEARGT